MMWKLIMSAFILNIIWAQVPPDTQWTRAFGRDYSDGAYQVKQTVDHNYIITGWASSSPTILDVSLLKIKYNGELIWSRTYGGVYRDIGRAVIQTEDMGYIIAGEAESYGSSWDVYLIKTDSVGNLLWQRNFGRTFQDGARSIQELPDGCFIIAGLTDSLGFGAFQVYLLKIDSQGNLIWEKTYGGQGAKWAEEVQQTNDNGYIIVGRSYASGNGDVYLVRTDGEGDTLWTRRFGGNGEDYGFSVKQTPDRGFVIAGCSSSFGTGDYDFYLIKTDTIGNLVWQKTFGGLSDDYGYSVIVSDEGYVISGSTNSFGTGGFDVYIIKTDTLGNLLWDKVIGGEGDDIAYSVQATSDAGWIVAGSTNSFGPGIPNNPNVYLIKLNTDVGIEDKKQTKGMDISFFPTIFKNKLTLDINKLLKEPLRIVLYDITGYKIYENFHNSGSKIELADEKFNSLKNGIYFLAVYSKGQILGTFKLIHLSGR